MAERTSSKAQGILHELDRMVSRGFVFPACARCGELLSAVELRPSSAINVKELKNRIREFVATRYAPLLDAWSAESTHVRQMLTSGHGLEYEELVALLTGLSELAFAAKCLEWLGLRIPGSGGRWRMSELRSFLLENKDIYPSAWSLPHSVVLECRDHWWWTRPGR
jgi:hypothetical protein